MNQVTFIEALANAAIIIFHRGNNHPTSDDMLRESIIPFHRSLLNFSRELLPNVQKFLRDRGFDCCQYNCRLDGPHPFDPTTTFIQRPPESLEEGHMCVAGYGRGRNGVGVWFCKPELNPDYLYEAAREMALLSGAGKQTTNFDAIAAGMDNGKINFEDGIYMMAHLADSTEASFLKMPLRLLVKIKEVRPDVILYRNRPRTIFNPIAPPDC